MTLKFLWTAKGEAFAERWASKAEVERLIAEEFKADNITVSRLIFHTVFVGPMADDRAFVVTPRLGLDDTVTVDVAHYESHGEVESGPLAGKDVRMPHGSEEADD